jgi:predicted nucleotidyltransferase
MAPAPVNTGPINTAPINTGPITPATAPVTTVADARAGLSRILRTFRNDPTAHAVIIGSHRKPEAVLVPFSRFQCGEGNPGATSPGSMLDRLHAKRDLIERIASLNKLSNVRVFGSVARGEETATSDVDLLVEPSDATTLFDLAQFEIDMEALLERAVDVLSTRSLDPERDAQILAEAVQL